VLTIADMATTAVSTGHSRHKVTAQTLTGLANPG
jgi:hypothetical protein